MEHWNPELYLQFASERTQPSLDLVSRVKLTSPQTIIDVGCGPGNSTQVLAKRWPHARIIGLDSSPEMIAKASSDYPEQEWVVADISSYSPEQPVDLVFSNAVIQWIPDHQRLLKILCDMVAENGAIAVQIPEFWEMPLGQAIDQVANDKRWKDRTAEMSRLFTFHDHHYYYDELSRYVTTIEIWQTNYMHVLKGHDAIIEMMRATGLKPYLDRLNHSEEKKAFEEAVLAKIKKSYPLQSDGNVLLPFFRLFFVGYRN